jgi:capsular polysaccharide export protein
MPERSFLFLQGPPSPFFSRIARKLTSLGCQTTAIHFCFGDQLFWRGPNRVNYRGRLSEWPAYIDQFLDDNRITDLVLLGEQRDYHKQAVEAAKEHGVRVTVTDFGYLRPDWITLERDGMSGNSLFPHDPDAVLALASEAQELDLERKYQDSTWRMSVGDLLYSFANVLFWFLYPHYRRSDHRTHSLIYFPAMGWQLLRANAGKREGDKQIAKRLNEGGRYFVFPLQLEHDFQITAYSPFDSLDDAIRQVLTSFASHARDDDYLMVKVHPWDPGFKNWKKRINKWSHELSISDRVDYLPGGDLDRLTEGASGMVTVNSTSGITALQLGCPVKILGSAVYDIPGLVHQEGLDSFWSDPLQPDRALVDAVLTAMASSIQIRGVYFSEPGLSAAVQEAVKRLYSGTVGEPR